MRKLRVEIDGETHDVEVFRDGRNVRATVAGREYLLDVSEPEPGIYLFKRTNTIYQASVSKGAESYAIHFSGHDYHVRVNDPKQLRGSGAESTHAAGTAEIKTAMPGKVVRILKNAGDSVEKGEGVIVVEAMKMQNEMKAPKDGTISDLKVVEGDTVGAGDVLVVIE